MSTDKTTIPLNASKTIIEDRDVEIKSANIKDALCNYSYELLTGKTTGDIINRKGNHIVHEDLENAFKNFNVFLAHLDDAFTGNDNSTELQTLIEEPETEKYTVLGLKVTGVEENKALVLVGNKYVDAGVISFTAPKVKLNGSYLYLTDLQETLDKALNQVEAYMLGKTAPQPEQTHMDFGDEEDDMENEFATAKVAGE